jgi:hypothetical protein
VPEAAFEAVVGYGSSVPPYVQETGRAPDMPASIECRYTDDDSFEVTFLMDENACPLSCRDTRAPYAKRRALPRDEWRCRGKVPTARLMFTDEGVSLTPEIP